MTDWKEEFNTRFGKVCLVDNIGPRYVGSYLIEFIDNVIARHDQQLINEIEWMKKHKGPLSPSTLDVGDYNAALSAVQERLRGKHD